MSTDLTNNTIEGDIFTVDTKTSSCNHRFECVRAGVVECKRCHFGLYTDPMFPIKEINKYYDLKTNDK